MAKRGHSEEGFTMILIPFFADARCPAKVSEQCCSLLRRPNYHLAGDCPAARIGARSPQERKLLIAETKECSIHSHHLAAILVINEACFLEPLHEEANAAPCSPDHFRQCPLADLRNQRPGCSMPIKACEQPEKTR